MRTHRDPGRGFLATAQAIVWVYLLIQGWLWIWAATVILGMEMADRARVMLAWLSLL